MVTIRREGEQDEAKGIAGTAGGGTAGALAGAAIGAAVGGPAGAAIGAGLGAVIGSAAGGAIDYAAHEPLFRGEFESSPAAGSRSWEDVAPAYHYGWDRHDRPEYQGKSWSQVRSDLKHGWTGGDWSEFEPHVRSAWERRATVQGRIGEP